MDLCFKFHRSQRLCTSFSTPTQTDGPREDSFICSDNYTMCTEKYVCFQANRPTAPCLL